MGGHIVAAVLLRRRKPEDMVVLVDGAAHRAQRIVAVGERVGDGEGLEPARLGGLDDADVSDVVRGERIEAKAERLVRAAVVRL